MTAGVEFVILKVSKVGIGLPTVTSIMAYEAKKPELCGKTTVQVQVPGADSLRVRV